MKRWLSWCRSRAVIDNDKVNQPCNVTIHAVQAPDKVKKNVAFLTSHGEEIKDGPAAEALAEKLASLLQLNGFNSSLNGNGSPIVGSSTKAPMVFDRGSASSPLSTPAAQPQQDAAAKGNAALKGALPDWASVSGTVQSPAIFAAHADAGMSSGGWAVPACSPIYADEELIHKAVLEDHSRELPIVSHASLHAAFVNTPHAIAVVRIARQTDAGFSFSCEAKPVISSPSDMLHKEDSTFAVRSSGANSNSLVFAAEHAEFDLKASGHHARRNSAMDGSTIARLESVFINTPLKRMLDVRDHEDYTFAMDKQLQRNPMLVMLFENSVQRLLRGKATCAKQYTPLFRSPTSVHPSAQCTFVSLQINTCGFQDAVNGSIRPALFLWYNAPSSQFDLTSQLKRNYMALSHVPSMVTVFAMDGRVLHQNSSSIAFMGFVSGSSDPGRHLSDPSNNLRRLFVLQPAALDDMLTTVADGRTWTSLVQMPAQLDLTEPYQEETSLFLDDQLAEGSEGSFAVESNPVIVADRPGKLRRSTSDPEYSKGKQHVQSCHGMSPQQLGDVSSLRGGLAYGLQCQRQQQQQQCFTGGLFSNLQQHSSCINRPPDIFGRSSSSKGPEAASPAESAAAQQVSPRVAFEGPTDISFSSAFRKHFRPRSTEAKGPSGMFANSRAMQMLFSKGAAGGRLGTKPTRSGGRSARCSDSGAAPSRKHAEQERWHQVQASKFSDPVTGEDVVMLIQTDVTSRVAAEQQLQRVLNAEHKLLEGIFPRQVLQALTAAAFQQNHSTAAECIDSQSERSPHAEAVSAITSGNRINMALKHEQVSILFADIVGFTAMSKEVEPAVVMNFLNDLYISFDELIEEHGVYKVETIGDCYMVAGGLIFTDAQGFKTVLQSQVDPLHAQRTLTYAVAMLNAASKVVMPDTGLPVKLRLGIHSGPVVSGVVGTRMPRFCLFGDSVNTASRMESNAPPGRIHVSADTHSLIGGNFWQASGGVQVKGKGIMETYYFDHSAPGCEQQLAAIKQKLQAAGAAAPSQLGVSRPGSGSHYQTASRSGSAATNSCHWAQQH